MSRAAHNVERYWAEQLDLMRGLPPAVRAREPESVHDLRAAGRRLKATVRVFQPLVRHTLAERLLIELDWYNAVLGRARDAEVVHDHLAELLADRLDARPLLDELATEQERLAKKADAMLATDRADQLDDLVEELTFRPWRHSVRRGGKGPSRRQLHRRVRWAERRVALAWRGIGDHEAGRREQQHRLRRRAKSARYAVEATASSTQHGGELAQRYAHVADLLGVVQDAVIVERVLAGRPDDLAVIAFTEQRRRSQQAQGQVDAAVAEALPPSLR